ncbi:lauroyl acyltransferase [Pseudoxanthomonas sp. J35]|uniref:lauroyl acyltransferase n=1 Tax=Pseudoxanthomonas sp. J35 TaxID=935852 RepID=UPI00048CA4C8|nr:lauroyl acyltransferase [Pseudoxanthomonas sp. J35]
MSTRSRARFLVFLASLLGRLPWPVVYRLGDLVAWSWRRGDVREARVARRNLELAFPELSADARETLRRQVLRTTARQALETLKLWTRPPAHNLDHLLRERHGEALYDAALAAGKGVIVAAPHFGNWELLNQWLASRGQIAIVYRPPESAVGDEFLQLVRGVDNVRQVRAEGPAVRQLWKVLKDGGAVGILPDQQPKAGDGEFSPFFGVEALTMTLLSRLAERTGAPVLLAWCERIGDGPQFALHVEPAPAAIADADPKVAVGCLNAEVERIARRAPAQYQWTYKRYTLRPPGSGEVNPYETREWAKRPA